MTQPEAMKIMRSGANVFLTGEPGAGKTYLLNQFLAWAEDAGKKVACTASTGMAASHINGSTIHSWSGLGIKEIITKDDIRKTKENDRLRKRYINTDILVIDEVSMLHGHRLDMVNVLAKAIRGGDKPFGGLQVILVGDLFQLPPVTRDSSELDFVHLSHSWDELDLKICYLTEQHRQASEDQLLDLLIAMRRGTLDRGHTGILQAAMHAKAPENVTRLYSHNADVDTINAQHLNALPGKPKVFNMSVDGPDKYKIEALKKNVLAPERLMLKVGAEVMFVANNWDAGFFNGLRGRVVKFTNSGKPVVETKRGRIVAKNHKWQTKEDDRVLAEVEQIPLRLAWAITIHKSQGMTLEAADVDLRRAFTPGMGYVALSRVESLDGLYLQGFNDTALKMHAEIYELDELLKAASALLCDDLETAHKNLYKEPK